MTYMLNRRSESLQSRHTCKFCKKVFVREDRILQHECKQMKRLKELQGPTGQAAYQHYSMWMRAQKRLPPPIGSFLVSKYFRTFVNFAQFAKNVNLPKPQLFIELMVVKTFSPTMWCSDDVYAIYLDHLDRKTSPLDQAKLSIETLFTFADKHEISLDKVFSVVKPQEIIHMLRTRQLSPWLLILSPSFQAMFNTIATPEQRIIIENLIRPTHMMQKMQDQLESVDLIKKLITEMGI